MHKAELNICVLGSGDKPLNSKTVHSFEGLNGHSFNAVNVDVRKLPTTDVIQDLNEKKWKNLPAHAFDVVIAEHVAEHAIDRLAFLDECRRIIKPNGKLIIEVPNWKHDSAHNTLEHRSTWGRCIFNPGYLTDGKYIVEKVVYRMTYPFTWKSFYLHNEFLGRQIDRFTTFISGMRFHLRVINNG